MPDRRIDSAGRDVGGATYPDRLAIFQGRNHVDEPAVTLASLRAGQRLRGVMPGQPVTLVGVTPLDDALVEIFFRDDSGRTGERMVTDADAGKL
jgi:hypothetical protein